MTASALLRPRIETLVGDCRETLQSLPEKIVQVCVTSPPYWGQRDYGVCHCGGEPKNPEHGAVVKPGLNPAIPTTFDPDCGVCSGTGRVPGTENQIGLEGTWQEYVENVVQAMREVRRVLRDDGTLWLNLGDSYAGGGSGSPHTGLKAASDKWDPRSTPRQKNAYADGKANLAKRRRVPGMNPKQLLGIPWRVAFAMQAEGWILRQEVTWLKRVPKPESAPDRPTSATEKIFLFSKRDRYFYDWEAVLMPPSEAYAEDRRWETGAVPGNAKNGHELNGAENPKQIHQVFERREDASKGVRLRNYWLLGPEPYAGAHFATFPSEVPRRAIKAGSRPGDLVLEPFGGSGTTAKVALDLGRRVIVCELNTAYLPLIEKRTAGQVGLL